MEKIKWCLQVNNGIELVEPNDNLSKVYLDKAEEALKASIAVKGNTSWEISSSYYSMYFALYSILIKIGIKCENHLCTIEFMKQFLSKYFSDDDVRLVKDSMGLRIDAQYYVDRAISGAKYQKLINKAPSFIAKCKDVRVKINSSEIKEIRSKIEGLLNSKTSKK